MTKIREVISAHIGVVAGLFGILSLFLLDFPFLAMIGEPYGWVTLSSGLQIAIEGTNLNPAEIVWESYPPQVYSDWLIPGTGFISYPLVFFVFIIIGGAILVEVAGLVTAVLTDEGQYKSAGKLIATGGGLIAFGSLISIVDILLTITAYYHISTDGNDLIFFPGFAVFAELIIGLVVAGLGLRIRRSSD
jgi:hypothetical protein